MYEEYWKLQERPFENTPDPRFLYYSSQHKEGLSRLLYAVREEKGAAMLTDIFGCEICNISGTNPAKFFPVKSFGFTRLSP